MLQFPRPVLGASMGPGSAEFGAGDVDEVLALEGIVRLSGLQSLELLGAPGRGRRRRGAEVGGRFWVSSWSMFAFLKTHAMD